VDTTQAGLHYHLPWPIETVLLPKVTQIKQLKLSNLYDGVTGDSSDPRDKQMLTGDENIVEADGVVFWRIKDAGQFLFKVNNPETSLRIAAESAMREVVSRTPIQAVMSNRRQQVADETRSCCKPGWTRRKAALSSPRCSCSGRTRRLRSSMPSTMCSAPGPTRSAPATKPRPTATTSCPRRGRCPHPAGSAGLSEPGGESGRAKPSALIRSTRACPGQGRYRLAAVSGQHGRGAEEGRKVVADSSGKGGNGGVLSLLQLQDKDKAKAAKETR
jgi:membrane protease subunit HflK